MIKKIKPFCLFVIAALLIVSCGNKEQFTIEGTIENGANKSLYIEELTPEGTLFIDSIAIDSKGHYKFSYTMPYPTFYNLCHDSIDYIVLRPAAGDKITLNAQYDNIAYSYEVTGSPESTLLWQLQRYSNDGQDRLREIVNADRENRMALESGAMTQKTYDKARQQLDSIYLDAYHEQQAYVTRFIQENQGQLATLIALYKPFNNHPLIDPAHNFDYYEFVLEGMVEQFPNNPHTINFKNTVEHLRYRYGGDEPTDPVNLQQ